MRDYLLILKGDGLNSLSPNELQGIFQDYQAWVEELGEQFISGQRLEENGALLTSKAAEIVTDGPFLETKEIIAGYFLIQAADLAGAIQVAKSSPHLGLYQIEVRPLVWPKMK